jgi:hypothetical protein
LCDTLDSMDLKFPKPAAGSKKIRFK